MSILTCARVCGNSALIVRQLVLSMTCTACFGMRTVIGTDGQPKSCGACSGTGTVA
jgi:hypothetical protein